MRKVRRVLGWVFIAPFALVMLGALVGVVYGLVLDLREGHILPGSQAAGTLAALGIIASAILGGIILARTDGHAHD